MKLEAVPGDITKEDVDAIVNAAVVQEDSGPIPAGMMRVPTT
ncbi:MAG TPA: hypothetical protein VMW33_00965 [Ilumatobacteraceae bacterium]|nr:hypothetical protein [Ilumatobacteraceae bacterium]